MTITTQTNRARFTGNAVTTAFDFTFKALVASDLVVSLVVSDVETVQTITTHYTVSLLTEGGTVTFVTAPANGAIVVIERSMAYTQPTDYANQGSFYPATHENSYDRATMQLQQIKDLIGRSPQVPPWTATTFTTELPTVAANRFVVINSGANGFTLSDQSPLADPTMRQDLAASSGSSLVGFIQSGTGAVASTVQARGRLVVYPQDFGATGDGSADDTVELQACIDGSDGREIDLLGLTYKCTAPLAINSSGTRMRNGTLSFASMADQGAGVDVCVDVVGTQASSNALTANTLIDSVIVAIASTASYSVDQLVFLESNSSWDGSTGTTYGQYARVKSIDSGTQLTLFSSVLMNFNTGNAATISRINPISNVVFQSVHFVGSGASSQNAIRFTKGENCLVDSCSFVDMDYMAVNFNRSYNCHVNKCRQFQATTAGLAYGYGVTDASYMCSITNSSGEDCRHAVSIGGTSGVNIGTVIRGNRAISSKDSGFESHASSLYTLFAENEVEMSAARFGVSNHNGLDSNGAHSVFVDNRIIGPLSIGVFYEPTVNVATSVVIRGNTMLLDPVGIAAVSSAGVYVSVPATVGPSLIQSILIEGNNISGGASNAAGVYGIYINHARAAGQINNLIISGNTTDTAMTEPGIWIRAAAATATISNIVINGNSIETTDDNAILIQAEHASSVIEYVTGGSNILKSVTNAWNLLATGVIRSVRLGRNIIKTAAVPLLNSGATDVIADDISLIAATVTGTTYSSFGSADSYVFNTSGTCTLTLPAASTSKARELNFKNIAAQLVISASSNVVPINSATAGTAILAASAGVWAKLKSDGTNWVVIAS